MALNFPVNPTVGEQYTLDSTTWQWDGTTWNVLEAGNGRNIFISFAADSGTALPDALEDVLTIEGGDNVTTSITDKTLTISSSGEANQNTFSNIAVSGQTTVTADNTTDTLTLVAGSNITLTTSGNTVTITGTASGGGSSDFNALGDATTASLSIDKIYEPAIAMLRVDNNGTSSYTFPSHYSSSNPTIYAISGTTIAFDLSLVPGHPFEIQDPTSTPYNTGLVHVATDGTVSTGASAQGKDSGTLYWRIPESISGTYRYQCQSHAPMVGGILIKRLSLI